MPRDDTMVYPERPWMVETFHRAGIALDSDALAPWQMTTILAATFIAALALESNCYKARKKPSPGFRGGAMVGMFTAIVALVPLTLISYKVLSAGAMKCVLKHCHGGDFTDLLGHRHLSDDRYVSMTFNPFAFWASYGFLFLCSVLALAGLFSCIRAFMHWRELD